MRFIAPIFILCTSVDKATCSSLSPSDVHSVAFDINLERKNRSPQVYKYTADILKIMNVYHREGNILDFNRYDSKCKLGLSKYDEVFVISCPPKSFRTSDIIQSSPKDDLNGLVKVFTYNGYTPLSPSEVDPIVYGFLHAVAATRRDAVFDYDTWIRYFSRPVITAAPGEVWEVSDRVQRYWDLMNECMEASLNMMERLGRSSFHSQIGEEECPPKTGGIVEIDMGSGERVEFVERSSCSGKGTTAVVCGSIDGQYFLKSYSRNWFGKEPLVFSSESMRRASQRYRSCNEKSILRSLSGIGEFIPKMHPILWSYIGNLSDACKQVSLVLENAGSMDLGPIFHKANPKMKYSILAQILENLSFIHRAGFAHEDLYLNNIIVGDESHVTETMTLIDYGASIPVSYANGNPTTFSSPFTEDLMRLADHLQRIDMTEYREFFLEVDALGITGFLRYEYWIERWNTKSLDL